MIKQFLHKSFSVLLALLVLFSTVSFTIEKHFCGDVLVGVSVFAEAEKCGIEAFEMKKEAITKKSCCKDELNVVQGQNELKLSDFDYLDFHQLRLITSFPYTFVNIFEALQQQFIPHNFYSPPNLVADIQVLDQVFMI